MFFLARSRRLAIGAALLALALVLFFLLRGRSSRPRAGTPAPPPVEAGPLPPARPPAPPAQKGVPRAPLAAPSAPIIDEIIVEKPTQCRGEENLITVRAHTPDGVDDAYLHYFISSDTGMAAPLRLHDRSDEATGAVQRQIVVFGRDNVTTVVPLPAFEILDCDPERQLLVGKRLLPNSESEFELTARIRDIAAAEPMTPVSYLWTFGDGRSAETTEPIVVHDFGDRAQDTLYSQFLISCEARSGDGERVVGRASLQLLNPAFEELAGKGSVRLSTLMTPRFPVLAADGTVTQEVRVWHHRREPVTLTRVILTRNYLAPPGSAPPPPTVDSLDPDQALGVRSIPRTGVVVPVRLDTTEEAQVFSIDYLLEGLSAEGLPAHGNFSLMRPPPPPTRESSRPIVSGYLKAKILRAREVLGKEYVTDEDIWMLERQGVMDDIRPEDYPPAEIPPPERPPAGQAPTPR